MEAQDTLIYAPNVIVAAPDDTIEMINTGAMRHDSVIDALGIKAHLPNGALVQITIPGHRPAGMTGTLIAR